MYYETTRPLLVLQGSMLIALLCSLFSLQLQQQQTAFSPAADPLVFPRAYEERRHCTLSVQLAAAGADGRGAFPKGARARRRRRGPALARCPVEDSEPLRQPAA